MSKPISFGFSSKSKPSSAASTPSTSKPGTPKPISLSNSSINNHRASKATHSSANKSALRDDSDEEDDSPPQHEELTGFSATGAILSKPKAEKIERVIENPGNADWRKRGRNLLPEEVPAVKNAEDVITLEKDEVSQVYGLQLAKHHDNDKANGSVDVAMLNTSGDSEQQQQPAKEMTDDDRALAALLDDGSGKPRSTAVISVQANDAWQQQRNETDDFRADVATRPESSTLDDYAAMPVEEFGMALLRGMGKKRRANGEVIDLNRSAAEEDKNKRAQRKQEGFLGIGAKPVKGLEGVELGAWGKADMRKNNRGEGFFTPVMLENRKTGEKLTEEEFEKRKKEAVRSDQGEEDWRDRRDRNLERSGRDRDRDLDRDYKEDVNGISKKRHRDEKARHREKDRDRDRDHDSSSSRRERDRDREYDRGDKHDSPSSRDRNRDRDRRRDKYLGEDRYHDNDDSSSSKRSASNKHRDRDKDRDRDRDRDRGSRDGGDRRYRDHR